MKMLFTIGIIFSSIFCSITNGVMVDLTYPYNNKTMVSPLVFPMQFEPMHTSVINLENGQIAKIEYNKFTMPEHLGTHMDAPSHVKLEGRTAWSVDQIPIDRLIGPAVMIDISLRAEHDPDTELTVDDIVKWEERYGTIQDGSIILINSGWQQNWGNNQKFFGNAEKDSSNYHFPGCGKDAAHWLVSNRNIHGIAVDTLSLDSGKNVKKKYAHLILLPENIYGLENVANMAKVPPYGAKLYVSPMKLEGGSGGPCRIFAEYGLHGETSPVFNSGITLMSLTWWYTFMCFALVMLFSQ